MKDIYLKNVEEQKNALKRAKSIVEGKLDRQLNGTLGYKKIKDRIYYYHYENLNGKRFQKYLRKGDPLIEKLARNGYYKDLIEVLKEEIAALETFNTDYKPEKKYQLYDDMTEERKRWVSPLFVSDKEKSDKWDKEEWRQYTGYPETLKLDTEAGHKVRSKSERTIVNLLYQHRDVLSYRYEQEIYLKETNIYVHPDFTVRNRLTGKIFYWEHAGMLDRLDYTNDFVRKMNAYTLEGMYPADNFLISFETSLIADNIAVVNKFIQILLMG